MKGNVCGTACRSQYVRSYVSSPPSEHPNSARLRVTESIDRISQSLACDTVPGK